MRTSLKWILYFAFLGVLSILSQTVLLREIATLFYGNELYYGISLGVWFLFTGLGSMFFPRIVGKRFPYREVVVLISFVSLLVPVLLVVLKVLRYSLVPYGEIPGLGLSLLTIILVLSAFCFLVGGLFSYGVSVWGRSEVNKAYIYETIGFGIGGLVFAYFLSTTFFPLGKKINFWLYSSQYSNIKSLVNSKYNHILVTENTGTQQYYINGELGFTGDDVYESEKLLNVLFPLSKNMDNVLLVGNPNLCRAVSINSAATSVGFMEIDELLLSLEKEIMGEDVIIYIGDPRKNVKEMDRKWNMVILDLGNPDTLSSNRYFTYEFFRDLRDITEKDGTLNIVVDLPTSYQSQEALRFISSVYGALNDVYPETELLFLEDQIVLVSSESPIEIHEENISDRWKDHFWLVKEDFRNNELINKINETEVVPNSDYHPTAFLYQQMFWQTMFNFKLPEMILSLSRLLPISLLLLYFYLYAGSNLNRKMGYLMSASSFILLSLEVLVILFFQVKIGYLYSQLSLLFSYVLIGIAFGVYLSRRLNVSNDNLLRIFLLYILGMVVFVLMLGTSLSNNSVYWFISIFSFGMLGGGAFSILNRRYMMVGNNPGYIYAHDLFGGSAGALLTSTILLPVFGVYYVLYILIVLAVLNVLLISRLQE